MQCVKCGGAVHDNRAKKAAGTYKPNAPDFACVNKDGCGWKSWPEKAKVSAVAAPTMYPAAPQSTSPVPSSRDTMLIELYWDCFDRVLAGIAQRKLADLFKPEHITAAISTLYIQRARG